MRRTTLDSSLSPFFLLLWINTHPLFLSFALLLFHSHSLSHLQSLSLVCSFSHHRCQPSLHSTPPSYPLPSARLLSLPRYYPTLPLFCPKVSSQSFFVLLLASLPYCPFPPLLASLYLKVFLLSLFIILLVLINM